MSGLTLGPFTSRHTLYRQRSQKRYAPIVCLLSDNFEEFYFLPIRERKVNATTITLLIRRLYSAKMVGWHLPRHCHFLLCFFKTMSTMSTYRMISSTIAKKPEIIAPHRTLTNKHMH